MHTGGRYLKLLQLYPSDPMTSAAKEGVIYASSVSVVLGEQDVISHDAATVYHSLFLASI